MEAEEEEALAKEDIRRLEMVRGMVIGGKDIKWLEMVRGMVIGRVE